MDETEPEQDNQPHEGLFLLSLYVAGRNHRSRMASENLERICREHLAGRYQIEIIDLREKPQLAMSDQIIAIPTVIRKRPPGKRVVGDLSDTIKVLAGLDIPFHEKASEVPVSRNAAKTDDFDDEPKGHTEKNTRSMGCDLQPYVASGFFLEARQEHSRTCTDSLAKVLCSEARGIF